VDFWRNWNDIDMSLFTDWGFNYPTIDDAALKPSAGILLANYVDF